MKDIKFKLDKKALLNKIKSEVKEILLGTYDFNNAKESDLCFSECKRYKIAMYAKALGEGTTYKEAIIYVVIYKYDEDSNSFISCVKYMQDSEDFIIYIDSFYLNSKIDDKDIKEVAKKIIKATEEKIS